MARQQNLTAYDAAYLELALREALPLATLDGRLRRAAGRVGDCSGCDFEGDSCQG